MSRWKPISTAPKDGSEVRVRWCHAGRYVIRSAAFDKRNFMMSWHEINRGALGLAFFGRAIRPNEWEPPTSSADKK